MRRLLLALLALLIGAAPAAAGPATIAWSELIDEAAQAYDDPYRALSGDQLKTLVTVARMRERLESPAVSRTDRLQVEKRLLENEATLTEAGIDIDWLISQRWAVAERRKRAATAANPAVDGTTVTLAGFAIPAPPDADGTPVVYLVPERGMCSHMPPPNPNQMVRARLDGTWTPSFMHEPVQVTGRLAIAPSEQMIHVVDGLVPMRASFRLAVDRVRTWQDMQATLAPDRPKAWPEIVAERLRARQSEDRETGTTQ